MEKYLGGPASKVLIRLLIASLIVGMILSFFGLSPYHLVDSVIDLITRIYNMGFEAVEWIFRYILLGAIIVIPFWLISRLFNILGTSEDPKKRTQNNQTKEPKVETRKSGPSESA